jgi:hypothetical protein
VFEQLPRIRVGRVPVPVRSRRIPAAVWVAILVVLLAVTCYEALVFLDLVPLGAQPGDGPAGEKAVIAVGFAALLLAAALCWLAASRPEASGEWSALFVAPMGAAVTTLRFYTFDPYYLPTLRRMSEGGFVPIPWLFLLVAAALLSVALTFLRRTAGLRVTAPCSWCALSRPCSRRRGTR